MSARLFIWLQNLLPKRLMCRGMWRLARCRQTFVKTQFIRIFLRLFSIKMHEAVEENPYAYPCFNAFFTRALKPDVRPLANSGMLSPVDGCVSATGRIEDATLLQAKGHRYTLQTLLANDTELVEAFRHGHFTTLYLAPKDYHRIHMPLDGELRRCAFVPGRLFSVDATTTAAKPDLFARNERLICYFQTEYGALAVIMIGALMVRSMETVWSGEATSEWGGIETRSYSPGQLRLKRGAEMGRFNMGSTVIVLARHPELTWEITNDQVLRMGQRIAALGHKTEQGQANS